MNFASLHSKSFQRESSGQRPFAIMGCLSLKGMVRHSILGHVPQSELETGIPVHAAYWRNAPRRKEM